MAGPRMFLTLSGMSRFTDMSYTTVSILRVTQANGLEALSAIYLRPSSRGWHAVCVLPTIVTRSGFNTR